MLEYSTYTNPYHHKMVNELSAETETAIPEKKNRRVLVVGGFSSDQKGYVFDFTRSFIDGCKAITGKSPFESPFLEFDRPKYLALLTAMNIPLGGDEDDGPPHFPPTSRFSKLQKSLEKDIAKAKGSPSFSSRRMLEDQDYYSTPVDGLGLHMALYAASAGIPNIAIIAPQGDRFTAHDACIDVFRMRHEVGEEGMLKTYPDRPVMSLNGSRLIIFDNEDLPPVFCTFFAEVRKELGDVTRPLSHFSPEERKLLNDYNIQMQPYNWYGALERLLGPHEETSGEIRKGGDR